MYSYEGGYIGYSRSRRSQSAIDEGEVPLSMINKETIQLVIEELEEGGICVDCENLSEAVEYIKKQPVKKWKFVAEHKGADSWHHTSKYYNETDHYDLKSVAAYMIENTEETDSLYEEEKKLEKNRKKKEKIEKQNYKYGVIKVEEWEKKRGYFRIAGYDEVAGIISGDWLYYKVLHEQNGYIRKYSISANKVVWIKQYDSYKELVSEHKMYNKSVKVFNKIIKKLKLRR